MEPRTRDSIIEGMEKWFIQAGAKDYDDGIGQLGKLVEYLQKNYEPMRSKEHFSKLLDEMPEPASIKRQFILGAIQYMPQLMRFGFKTLAAQAEEDFPKIPAGRPGLDAFTKAQIVAGVGKWHTLGHTLDQAKKRAARHFKVSESTVQRAWDDRGNSGVVDFRSVIKYLALDEESGVEDPESIK